MRGMEGEGEGKREAGKSTEDGRKREADTQRQRDREDTQRRSEEGINRYRIRGWCWIEIYSMLLDVKDRRS